MIQAFLFDLDGTLIDSNVCHRKASKEIFRTYNVDYEILRNSLKQYDFHGMRVREFLKILKDASPITEQMIPFEDFYNARQALFYSLLHMATSLPGACNALKQVAAAKKPLALVTSGTRKLVDISRSMFFPNIHFDVIITSRDVKKGKPDPECYETAFKALLSSFPDIVKNTCLVIEDSKKGIQAAKNAGMKTLYIPYMENMDIQADFSLPSLEEFQISDYL